MIINLALNFNEVNISAQVGDIVYRSALGGGSGGFNSSVVEDTVLVGPIVSIVGNQITVSVDLENTTYPDSNSFYSFAKNKVVNTSSLLGYYAEAHFYNNSRGKVELFSVGSEITESSK